MNTLLTAVLALFSMTAAADAQNRAAEQEVRSFLDKYDRAVADRDIEFLERVLPADYVCAGPSGKLAGREAVLRYFRRQRESPDHKRIFLAHENVKVHVAGNMAVVTNDWTSQTAPIDAPADEAVTDRGRHTGVLEKRDGRWMVIAEHDSEQIYSDEFMLAGVRRAVQRYRALTDRVTSADPSELGRLLADEYSGTNQDGDLVTRDLELQRYSTSRTAIRSAEYSEQNIRTIGNGLAIETGKVKYAGTNAGIPFEMTQRYTRTWAFYSGRWQVTANHASRVAK
jgi:ketosteroid isomerase-like protein